MDKDDYLAKYRSVSNKLKKKFMRKPNVAEVAEQYGLLAKKLHDQEALPYAAFFKLAQARCEHTQGNSDGEAGALIQAARMFLKAHRSLTDLNCPCFNEHLEAAFNCYNHSIRVCSENQNVALAACLCVELGNTLTSLNRPSEAIPLYQKAAQYYASGSREYVNTLQFLASAHINIRQYEEAIATLTECLDEICGERVEEEGASGGSTLDQQVPWGCTCDELKACESTLVLLLMVVQPTPQHIDPRHARILEKYTWDAAVDNMTLTYLEEDFYLLLQSLVLACQSHDRHALLQLQKDLYFYLTPQQNHLITSIIETMDRTAFPLA